MEKNFVQTNPESITEAQITLVEEKTKTNLTEAPSPSSTTTPKIIQAKRKVEQHWNQKVTRSEIIQKTEERITFYRNKELTVDNVKKVAYLGSLLIQVINGLRVGEGWEALKSWINNGERSTKVQAEKKKLFVEYKLCVTPGCSSMKQKRRFNPKDVVCSRCNQNLPNVIYRLQKKPDMIPIKIPDFLSDVDRQHILNIKDFLGTKEAVRSVCYRELKVNSHSLRYSYVRMLRKQGRTPDEAAELMHHSSSTVTKHYFDEDDEGETKLKYADIR